MPLGVIYAVGAVSLKKYRHQALLQSSFGTMKWEYECRFAVPVPGRPAPFAVPIEEFPPGLGNGNASWVWGNFSENRRLSMGCRRSERAVTGAQNHHADSDLVDSMWKH